MRLKKLDKIRLVVMLPLSLAFIVVGSIALSSVSENNQQTSLYPQLNTNFLNTETNDLSAQVQIPLPTSSPLSNSRSTPAEEIPEPTTSSTPVSTPGPGGEENPTETEPACEPMKEYCNPAGANLLDDVDFPQSHDGSFENPICSLMTSNGEIAGKGCDSLPVEYIDNPTHYQANSTALIPIRSQLFYVESEDYQAPEYNRQEVAGPQQCQEKLLSHGNNSFKIFSRDNKGIRGGLCIPIKDISSNLPISAGINFRVSQQTENVDQNIPVTFRLGYVTTRLENDFNQGGSPAMTEGAISWLSGSDITIISQDYPGTEDYAGRYAGGFLSGQLPSNASGLCFMAVSTPSENVSVNTFWDAAFATKSPNACENALDHSDGVDRSCGGYACGNVDPTYSGNYYTDFDQEYYTFDMPEHWNVNQCHYETKSNGADSPYGTLFVGLDLNNCDINYKDPKQRNLHPDYRCQNNENWTYGYAWTGGIKDFGLLQYLDCAIGTSGEENFKGTQSNPFFCSQILNAYTNTKVVPGAEDPAFTLRYSNTYSGLVSPMQAEGQRRFWKVPLLGSAVGTGVINNYQVDRLNIDPFFISKRNSGSGLNNMLKYNLANLIDSDDLAGLVNLENAADIADFVISRMLREEEHLFEESIVPRNEVMIDDLLASGPVCNNTAGEPITKIHYGSEDGLSDRAIFGFADDGGSSEHEILKENLEITPKELCNLQFREGQVVGAECVFFQPGPGVNEINFTEANIDQSLEDAGYVTRYTVPTYAPPAPSGIPVPGFDECPEVSLCGDDFGCGHSMRDVYNQCIDNRPVDEIRGNPFIRKLLPNGWKDLEIHGLSKLLESTWHNEFIQYNHPIRHENVGTDVNQVVSIYDQQQPKCTALGEDRKPVYCTDDPVENKSMQVCRRVSPYDCGCNESNFDTCRLNCPSLFARPDDVPTEGLDIEGTPTPAAPGEPVVDTSIRAILNNGYPSFLEKSIRMLLPKTYEGEGAENYEKGQIYSYDPRYIGGFLLANTGDGSQCTSVNPESKTGASQVRIENYYAYVGQVPRMNERIGFAATNNVDSKSYMGETVDISTASILDLIQSIMRGEGEDYIALPYCDLLTESEKMACSTSTDSSCDCFVRSCSDQHSAKIKLMEDYLPTICERQLEIQNNNESIEEIYATVEECYHSVSKHWMEEVFPKAFETCEAKPRTNLNFNCDPMASYLIEAGFDTPELRFAACEDMLSSDQCSYDKFGVHLITGPVQEDNYSRAENLGLKWKMEVITDDTPEMVDAMAHSVNSFSGKTVFRFCNADHENDTGERIQDPSCAFRTELTTSSSASGKKVAEMILKVAEKTSKPFLVSPVNEPISEHWVGGDPNDPNNTTNMVAVSEFYKAFAETLDSNPVLRAKIEIGGPTYNVTAFGNYDNFDRSHSEFSAKDVVDYWTINIYNDENMPSGISRVESQFLHAKTLFNDSKLIGINETGDFQHNIGRLTTSLASLGSDPKLKYAILFNAFGGWGDDRGQPLILSDGEIREVLSENRSCVAEDPVCYIDGGDGGTIQANPLPFGRNFTLVYDQLLPPETQGGRTCSELPPAAGEYFDPSDVGMKCEAYGIRSQLPQYDFYRGALRRCGIPIEQTRWTEENTYNQGGDIEKIKNQIRAKNITYGGKSLNEASDEKLTLLLTKARDATPSRNPMVLISIWATESVFGLYGNKNEFNCGSAQDFNSSLDCILGLGYMVDTPIDQSIDIYGPYCHNETYATGSGNDGGGQLVCPEPGPGGNLATPECFVSPMNGPYTVTQCFGNTVDEDNSNSYCLSKFDVDLSGISYEVLGSFHGGIDMVNSTDKDVFASAAGVVTEVKYDGDGYGNYVVLEHEMANSGTVYYTRYGHLASTNVSVGQTVDHNTKIGVMGDTGFLSGPHLHFEISSFPQKVNPLRVNRDVLRDPTDAVLRDRNTANTSCTVPADSGLVEVGSENGITRYNLDGLIVIKVDKNQYTPAIEWDSNAKTLRQWAGPSSAQILINASLFESGYISSGRLKIRNNIIKDSMSPTFAASNGHGYLAFNSNDFNIRESSSLSLGSHQNILESVPILILDGRKYTSNGRVNSRSTSIGYDNSGNFIIVIAPEQGKHSYSRIADLLLSSGLDINSLLNLDGGGSTGLIIKGSSIGVDASSIRAIPGIMTFTKK